MPEPNFFIIGAPKCGTTALSDYLRDHPRIFMPVYKEPHFYNTDHPKIRGFKDRDKYLALFDEAGDAYDAVGEASIHYLRSEEAVPNILEHHPDAKFIVMVREPVAFLRSWHNQLLYSLMENEKDFAKAWALRIERRTGKSIPVSCPHPMLLDYEAAASFGAQVERLLSHVAKEQVLFIRFEDFIADNRKWYLAALDFLGVPDDGKTEFARSNPAHQNRSRLGGWVLDRGYKTLSRINPFAQGNPIRSAAKKLLMLAKQSNTTYHRPEPIPDALATEIVGLLREDHAKLADLTGIRLDRPASDSDTETPA
ncbi:MAG: sulfotransferase [Planctomycetota bacterium]